MLETLCEALVEALDISVPGFLHSVPAAMQALSSVGRVAPAVFAQHAAAVADFVLEVTQNCLLLSSVLHSGWVLVVCACCSRLCAGCTLHALAPLTCC